MRYGIFTSDKDFAYSVIQTCIKDYTDNQITKKINNNHLLYIELVDGTVYQWYRPSENSRGVKVNTALIDIDTCSLDIIRNIIMPCTMGNEYEVLTHDYVKYDLDTLLDRLIKIRAIKGNLTDIGMFDSGYGWQNIMNTAVIKDESLVFGLLV